MLWTAYQLRIRQVARQFNRTLDTRVSERTRIARDLHDGLLQSFHGALLRFRAAAFLLPERPADASDALERALDEATHAVVEARDTVQGLRSATDVHGDLPLLIGEIGKDLGTRHVDGQAPAFRVNIEGSVRELVPLVRDEIAAVVREALRNAFRHAHASQIAVEIRYDPRQLRLRVRDDGKGIDQQIVDAGSSAGHYGLTGMRERAELLNGRLSLWSDVGAGTELELTVAGSVAYANRAADSRRSTDSRHHGT